MIGEAFGRAFDALLNAFVVLLCLAPFGIWKLIEIAIWIYRHVSVGVN